jgi:hypothetical protein
MRCSVYIIIKPNSPLKGHSRGVAKGNCVKIGIAQDIQQRFVQLDCHPEPLEIVAEYIVDSRTEAQHIEQQLHKILNRKHVKGEWFYFTTNELKTVDDMIVSFYDVEVHYYNKDHLKLKEEGYEHFLCLDPPYVKQLVKEEV